MKKLCNVESRVTDTRNKILAEYGNTAFLRKCKNYTLDDVRGTHLWELWYGSENTDLSVRAIDENIRNAKGDLKRMKNLYSSIKWLLKSLKKEFNRYQ